MSKNIYLEVHEEAKMVVLLMDNPEWGLHSHKRLLHQKINDLEEAIKDLKSNFK